MRIISDFYNDNNPPTKARIPFSKEEDDKIKELVKIFGTRNWLIVSSFIKGRSSKQCRDRYCNSLQTESYKRGWSKEEDELITRLYNKVGPKWSIIKKSFPHRSSHSIKNRWCFFLCRQNPTTIPNSSSISSSNSSSSTSTSSNSISISNDTNHTSQIKSNFKKVIQKQKT